MEAAAGIDPRAPARTRLGWSIARRVLAEAPTGNVFLSPHSLAGALAVAQAAGVVEADSIGRLLDSPDPASHAALSTALSDPDPEGVDLRLAQSLWTDLGVGFERADDVRAHFPDVEWRARDFRDPSVVAEMNAWADEKTDGMIDHIVDEIRDDEALAILDAILFVGRWATPFENTREAPFRTGRGATVQMPLMELGARVPYGEGDGWRAVRLEYGSGRIGFLAVVPEDGLTLAQLAERVEWDVLLAGLRTRNGVIRLPRFRLETTTPLLGHLSALGLGPPDGPVLETHPRIGRILQRAVLEVDEQGTRAAAVTFLGAEITSVPPPPFDFTADRPFLCAIHDRDTGSLLFVGAVQDPQPITE